MEVQKIFSTFLQVFGIALILSAFSGCCKKKDCMGIDDMIRMDLENFTGPEVEIINVEAYDPAQSLSTPISSFGVRGYEVNGVGDTLFYFFYEFNPDFVYELDVPNINKIYTVEDFTSSSEVCNNCIFSNDYYDELKTYKINGTVYNGSRLILYK